MSATRRSALAPRALAVPAAQSNSASRLAKAQSAAAASLQPHQKAALSIDALLSGAKAKAAASRGPVGGAQQDDDDDDGGADASSASSRSEDDLSSAARELQEQKEEQAALLDDREDLQEQVNARDARVDQLIAQNEEMRAQVAALVALVTQQSKAAPSASTSAPAKRAAVAAVKRLTHASAVADGKAVIDWLFELTQQFNALGLDPEKDGERAVKDAMAVADADLNGWWKGAIGTKDREGRIVVANDWESFNRAIKSHFIAIDDARKAEVELLDIRQQSGEGMEAYFRRAMLLQSRAGKLAPEERTMVRLVFSRLNNAWPIAVAAVGTLIENGGVSTFAELRHELVYRAMHEPVFKGAQHQPQQQQSAASSSPAQRGGGGRNNNPRRVGDVRRINALHEAMTEAIATGDLVKIQVAAAAFNTNPAGEGTRPPGTRGFRDFNCVKCGEKGHGSRGCTSPTELRKCHKCDKAGHLMHNCPNSKNE